MSGSQRIGGGRSSIIASPNVGGGEFWQRVTASIPVSRLSAVARAMDPVVFINLDAGGPYAVRGVYYFTAEGGGPSLVWRMTGPTLSNPGGTTPATSMNIVRALAAGSQDTVAQTPGYTTRLTYDVADITTVWNTGAPARAMGRIEINGVLEVTGPGAFGIEWTSSNAIWALTRIAGSYLEYAPLF